MVKRSSRLLPQGYFCSARIRAGIFSVLVLAVTIALLAPRLFAQNGPHVAAVDPASAKVNDSVSITGQNLGKASVAAIYLSDDKDDYKATLSDQADGKITFKIPQVKTGSYNISLQVSGTILIQPVRISIQ
jgi:hypothetical protein